MSYFYNLRTEALAVSNMSESELLPLLQPYVEQAVKLCEVPYAFISIRHQHSLPIKIKKGFKKTNIESSCLTESTLNNSIFYQIPDLLDDPRFKNESLSIDDLAIRFYASTPLISSNNEILGALVVVDNQPRELQAINTSCLTLLAQTTTAKLELLQKNNELTITKSLFENITENHPDITFIKDKNFKFVYVNSAFYDFSPEKDPNKILSHTALEKYNDNEIEEFLEQDKIAFEKGISIHNDKVLLASGEIKIFKTTKKRFIHSDGEPYILGVARDITKVEKLIQLLKKSNEDLDNFAYIACHDLKSPLIAIQNLVEWIEEDTAGTLDSESTTHFEIIKNRVDRMRKMLDDLFKYSQIGRSDDEIQTLNLQNIVNSCYDLLDIPTDFIINSDNIDIRLPKTPLEVVLTNLLSNAIKHHTKPKANIEVNCHDKGHFYEISVTDDGPGIDPKYHQKIFKEFAKLKSNDELFGTGLGLAIVKKVLNFYSATISIESNLGEGCKFIVCWPKSSDDTRHFKLE